MAMALRSRFGCNASHRHLRHNTSPCRFCLDALVNLEDSLSSTRFPRGGTRPCARLVEVHDATAGESRALATPAAERLDHLEIYGGSKIMREACDRPSSKH